MRLTGEDLKSWFGQIFNFKLVSLVINLIVRHIHARPVACIINILRL
jgi:hypothetical protein